MPSKDSGYTLSSKSSCTNGVTLEWNQEKWGAFVDYTNYKKENSSSIGCSKRLHHSQCSRGNNYRR